MGKTYRKPRKNGALARFAAHEAASPWLASVLFFLAVCLLVPGTAKVAGLVLILLLLLSLLCRFAVLRERLSLPVLALTALVLMDGISVFYAVSGKFALSEFLKVLSAFCLALLLLAWAPGKGKRPGRWVASVLERFSALGGLISIDLLSTRLISGAAVGFLGLFAPSYLTVSGLEAGVRMTSLFGNPNVFAGTMGLGALLSLGLARSAETRRERYVHLALLYINSLAFVLAFSMGASSAIAVAFLAYLALERAGRRAGTLVLMLETLALTAVAAALISKTSFQAWEGFRPAPLLCVPFGAAALYLADRFPGRWVTEKLEGRGKAVPILTAAVLAALIAFGFAAFHLTGDVTLRAGEGLRRAAYPAPGDYALEVEADAPLTMTIRSQNQQETMMHTSTLLYSGDAAAAAFTVPEGSMVVYFNFSAPEGAHVLSVSYAGGGGSGSVPLGYRLLPGFIANRLQGLFANENAIQRTVFFADGIRLFRRSPVFGLGIGAFENGIKSVQSFYYETKYAHNHYIQSLVETGVIGLLLFIGLLAVSAAAIRRSRRGVEVPALLPAMGAALLFMAGHAATELIFSFFCYLPAAFGMFALIGLECGGALPRPKLAKAVRSGILGGIAVLTAAFGILLACNVAAARLVENTPTLNSLDRAIELDRFEWADYMLGYVVSTQGVEVDGGIRRQADEYALRLAKVNSNTIPFYLADYYFQTGRPAEAIAMLEKYVDYVASDASAWQNSFDLLRAHAEDSELFRAGVESLARRLEARNANSMETITVNEEAQALIAWAGA